MPVPALIDTTAVNLHAGDVVHAADIANTDGARFDLLDGTVTSVDQAHRKADRDTTIVVRYVTADGAARSTPVPRAAPVTVIREVPTFADVLDVRRKMLLDRVRAAIKDAREYDPAAVLAAQLGGNHHPRNVTSWAGWHLADFVEAARYAELWLDVDAIAAKLSAGVETDEEADDALIEALADYASEVRRDVERGISDASSSRSHNWTARCKWEADRQFLAMTVGYGHQSYGPLTAYMEALASAEVQGHDVASVGTTWRVDPAETPGA